MKAEPRQENEFRLFSYSIEKPLVFAYILITIYFSVFFMQLTTLLYVVKELEISSLHFGYLQTFSGILQVVGSPFFEYFSQKYGIRFGLCLCFGSTLISAILLFGSYNLQSLFISRIPNLFVQGQQVHQTLLSQLTNPGKERTVAFGRMGLFFGVGYTLVPVFSTMSTYVLGSRGPLLAGAALCIVPAFIMDKCTEDKNFKQNSNGNRSTTRTAVSWRSAVGAVNTPGILNLLFKKTVAVAPMFLIFSILQMYVIDVLRSTPEDYSMIQVLIGVSFIFSNGFGVIWFRKKFDEQTLLIIGGGAFIIAYFLFQFFTHLWMIIIIMPLATLGMSVISTVCDSMLTSVVSSNEQGVVLGFANAVNAFAQTFAPAVAAVILTEYGFSTFGMIGLSGTLIGLATSVFLPIEDPHKPHKD